jgi:CHAT domain-containing protein/tetratricopeptide (TPR) repeat protein
MDFEDMDFEKIEDLKRAWEAAEAKRSRGEFIGAYADYCNILDKLVKQSLPQWTHDIAAQIIQAVAHLSSSIGNFETADRLFQDLVEFYQLTKNYPFANFTVIKRIELQLDLAELRKVTELFESLGSQISIIGDISPSELIQWEVNCSWKNADISERSILFAHLYLVLGRSYAADGQYRDALTFLERGLWHTRAETPSLAQQICLSFHFSIASAYLEQGKLDKALAKLADLQTAFDPNSQPELKVRWLETIGKISLLRGELGQALDRFQQVQKICQDLGLTGAVIRSTLNLAHVLILINQNSLAKDYLLGALSEKLAQQDPGINTRLKLLLQLAEARGQSLVSDISGGSSVSEMRSGAINSSQDAINDRLEDITFSFQSSNYLALFEFRVLQFYWLLSRRDLGLANRLLSGIQSAFELKLEPRQGSDSQLIQIKIKILLGTLAYYQGVEFNKRDRLDWAASILDEVRPDLKRMGLKADLWQVQRILGWCWSRLKSRDLQAEIIESNNKLLEELTKSLRAEDRAIYLLNKWTTDEEYIAGEINCIQQLGNANSILLKPWQHWQSMHRLHRLLLHIDRYKDTLAKRTLQNQNQPLDNPSVYSLWERVFTHPRNLITLVFLVLPDRVLIVRVGWLLLDYQLVSTTRLELRNLIQGWHSKIQGFNRDFIISSNCNYPDNIENDNREISQQLSEILKLNLLLKGLPKRIKSISIVPDDILHGFPFASILHENKYLIEKYAISISYESRHVNKSRFLSSFDKSLVVGVSQGNRDFNSLPNVQPEIARVETWMNQHQLNPLPLINAAADKKTIIQELSQAEFFHIACHGVFKHSQPELSGLVLIPNPAEPAEIMSLRELSYLDLSKLRHATLSSCWSADHFVLPGRWIISLPETLWRSGTESILGCLWEVNDIVAVSFMTRFYHYLEIHPRDKALQLTQQDCLTEKLSIRENFQGNLRNPLYWSGFTLYGTHKKLDLLGNSYVD